MTASQAGFPIVPSKFKFAQHGQSGAWISELMPHTAKMADELCFIKTMHTEAINHDPGMTFPADRRPVGRGRPSVGAWLSYGPRQHEPGPAHLRRHGLEPPAATRCTTGCGGNGFPALRAPGRQVSSPPATRSSTCRIRGGVDRSARRRFPGRAGHAQPAGPGRVRRPGDGHPHRAVRDGLPHAGLGARADRSVGRAGVDLRALRPPTRRRPARSRPTACWPGAWRSATCASSSSSTAAGTCTPSLPQRIRTQGQGTSTSRRPRCSRT